MLRCTIDEMEAASARSRCIGQIRQFGVAEIGSNALFRITMMCAAWLFSFDADQACGMPGRAIA
jgi:hypothetical protein